MDEAADADVAGAALLAVVRPTTVKAAALPVNKVLRLPRPQPPLEVVDVGAGAPPLLPAIASKSHLPPREGVAAAAVMAVRREVVDVDVVCAVFPSKMLCNLS